MNRENGSGGWTHPIQWAGLDVRRALMLQVAPQEQWQHLRRIHALPVRLGEIGGAIVVHDARHTARLLEIRSVAFKLGIPACEPKKQSQMPSGRTTGHTDPLRIEA